MSGQGDLFGEAKAPARAADTSQQAAKALEPSVVRYRALVFHAIENAGAGGLTADEAADVLKLGILTVRPRCSELRAMGLVKDSGQRRPNASGNPMIVWVRTDG